MKESFAEKMNRTCSCKTLKREVLEAHIEAEELLQRPHLFSSTMVFISKENYEEMAKLISTIEKVIATPDYQKMILSMNPEVSLTDHHTKGVFMGYDFHVSDKGIKLIEINTNAGGALLNAELAKAQHACCIELDFNDKITDEFVEMFRNEWRLQNGDAPLKTIAIIDENPAEQYLYPEFRLFQKLLSGYGFEALIADPKELLFRDHQLFLGERKIDLIYNRLTDFYFKNSNNSALLKAYETGSTVFTPAPHHHALYANKSNLELIREFPLSKEESEILKKGIPHTVRLDSSSADEFWSRRKNLFFKPVSGYGSKASYRGDKITRKVWEEIIKGDYVAQEIVPPGNRLVDVDGKEMDLKLDVRAYAYDGKIQLLASRLYSGQTTNFRTSGGGFAPVFVTP